MQVEVLWTPGEARDLDVAGRRLVVVDVLRAATTILAALEAGARQVIPVSSLRKARRLVRSLGPGDVLLCGERGGRRIEGFDLGNSPVEFTQEVVGGKTLVMSTTNGTPALRRAAGAEEVMVACFRNLTAVAERLDRPSTPVAVTCAGKGGRVSLDDALCAGLLVAELEERRQVELDDGARAARVVAGAAGPPDEKWLAATAAGRALLDIGRGEDLRYCARLNASSTVPVLREGAVVLAGEGREPGKGG